MAVFKSPLIAAMSGSMAGMTATRGQAGKVLRRRAVPNNPNTPPQRLARQNLGNISIAWQKTTAEGRARWQALADNTTRTNALGDATQYTARELFIKYNTLLLTENPTRSIALAPGAFATINAGLAPAIPNITQATTITYIIPPFPNGITLTDVRTAVLLFISNPMSPAESPRSATFTYWGSALGGTPPGDVRTFARAAHSTAPDIRVGQRHFARLIGIHLFLAGTGSMSPEQTVLVAPRVP